MKSPRRAGAPERKPDSRLSPQTGIVPSYAPVGHPLGVVSRPAEYLMIESFEAQNFECFESLKLSGLKRMNIITGDNASGKTALLEALYAASRANSEGLLLLNQNRGLQIGPGPQIPGLPTVVSAIQFPAIWERFFHFSKANGSRVPSKKTNLSFVDSNKKTYLIDYSFEGPTESIIQPSLTLGGAVAPLHISRRIREEGKPEQHTQSVISLGPQGQLMQSVTLQNIGPTTFIFPASLNYVEADNVMWFSQLREKQETDEIIAFFKTNFPFLINLEVLAPEGISGIYATLLSGGVRRLQLVSAGVYKIVSLLLGCARSEGGIIMIDEIENGLFYDKYALTWFILNKFSKKYGCQVFVTSHSKECLEQLPNIIGDDVASFELLRTERENGKCIVRQISGTAMKAALMGGNEIRGTSNGPSSNNS
jgi:hypothetical protein